MKVRNGFVSNSSTTSFCIYGTHIDLNDVRKFLRKNDLFTEINPDEIEDDYDLIDKVTNSSKYLVHITDNDGGVFIGRDYWSLKDDETGGQFKKTTKEEFNRLFEKEFHLQMINDYVSG